ncbi:radical SAM protein [Neptuniibacter sp.]|uniref:radical SAM protein n=1 Tax=Neptuniibacter sp. TaxID=1962643 RepID=UPI002618DCCC|nr:radical SAM protein [Neptuniibacter sp.]MCP4595141.1 radical SAM protein [Neptuniibacter sp.]
MQRIHTENWFKTPEGEDRGYIDPFTLRELWFHTGTACNLQCPFCLEGSGPGDKRLELVKFDDVKPYIDEAIGLGVEQFSFTGGEPFLAKQLVKILAYAAERKPCLVLTNGTEAIQQRMDEVASLTDAQYPVSFRVSIDKPTAEEHDAGRGEGNFVKAMQGLKKLHDAGFHVSVARHMDKDEDKVEIETAYQSLFAEYGLPVDLNIVAFPDFATPGSLPLVPQVTTTCMTTYQTEESRKDFMCAFSKMVVKKNGQMRVYACTLVDDDEEYDLGANLRESLSERISMKHHRCYSCFAYGASCSE